MGGICCIILINGVGLVFIRRGPLRKEWQRDVKPVMCAYKMVKVDANYWGVQNRVEKLMLNGIHQVVLLTHRNAFCWLDEWFDLTYEEICDKEQTRRQRLKATVKQLPIIDPATGKELVIEDEENGKRIEDKEHTESDYSDTSDIEAEYFEAEVLSELPDVSVPNVNRIPLSFI
jgi:hypothetical protein